MNNCLKTDNYLFLLILIILFATLGSYAQNTRFSPVDLNDPAYRLTVKKMIIPAVLVGYGVAGFVVKPVDDLNLKIRSEITSRVNKQFRIDDYSQWAMAASPGIQGCIDMDWHCRIYGCCRDRFHADVQ
ncbi:MAG: hypothetical protein NTV01_13155 [Bacteroidia bacterium]|nr:hypothetical protein [Bacteroidia bacterium]